MPNGTLVAARRASYAHIHSRTVSHSEMSPGPRTDREKNTDKTTKLLSAVLILFLVAEFPQVLFSRSLCPLDGICYPGNTGHADSHLWSAVLP
jgi:hypothetical protein